MNVLFLVNNIHRYLYGKNQNNIVKVKLREMTPVLVIFRVDIYGNEYILSPVFAYFDSNQ